MPLKVNNIHNTSNLEILPDVVKDEILRYLKEYKERILFVDKVANDIKSWQKSGLVDVELCYRKYFTILSVLKQDLLSERHNTTDFTYNRLLKLRRLDKMFSIIQAKLFLCKNK